MDRSTLEQLKTRADLVEVVRSSGIILEKRGKNWFGRCPWHADKEASLSVNPEAQLYNCFGCEEGGDVLSFLQRRHGLSFPEAVERLEELAGSAPERKNGKAQGNGSADRLPGGLGRPEVLGRVAQLYHRKLLEDAGAQKVLIDRGLGDRALWEGFQVGFADGTLADQLPPGGDVREALVALGVLNESGRELMKGCLVVPLTHPDLGVVGLYGRKLDPKAKVRHLFLPGPKRGVLNWQALKRSSRVVVAEGVLDALSLWSAGVKDVTCLFGTQGPTEDLESLLGRYAVRELVLCLDGDEAGRKAAERLVPRLVERGFSCFGIQLPEGEDPNSVLTGKGAEALKALAGSPAPLSLASSSLATASLATVENRVERVDTEDGFSLAWGDLVAEVRPLPPFHDKLKVKLRVSRGRRVFLERVDLCSHRNRAMTINKLAQQFELLRSDLERYFQALIVDTEQWAAAHVEEPQEGLMEVKEAPELSDEEQAEARSFLRKPELVDLILDDMEALGYVGEREAKLLCYLIGISRKLERPLSGIILSQSGAGKSCLTELIEMLTPEEDVEHYARLSPQALMYLPKSYLKGKLLIIEERVGAEQADYHIRVLQTRRRLSQAVAIKDPVTGKFQTCRYEVEGPIAYLETTTSRRINHENATRCFEIELDESQEQTRRIQEQQRRQRGSRRLDSSRRNDAVAARHKNAQRLLEPVQVVIPYAELLRFPIRWLRTRRDNERFLCLIEAVTFLHQHQREGGVTDAGERFVLSTAADYRLAFDLAREVLASTFHELTREARALWGLARELVHTQAAERGKEPGSITFTRRELRQFSDWEDHRMREALKELGDMEYLGVLEGCRGRTFRYQLLCDEAEGPSPVSELTTPDELEALLR